MLRLSAAVLGKTENMQSEFGQQLTREIEIQSPEIQTMYSLNMPVSAIRTKVRQEFEKHRYVSQLQVVDVLLFQSHAEFQVSAENRSQGYQRQWIWIQFIGGSINSRPSALELNILASWTDPTSSILIQNSILTYSQETLNFWKQLSHVMKYFRPEEDPGARLPKNFVSGFLEGRN